MAAAVGAATDGIFWCGNAMNGGPFTRARHRPLMSWRLACPVCAVNCMEGSCAHRASFVAGVPVHAVADAALELLADNSDRGALIAPCLSGVRNRMNEGR